MRVFESKNMPQGSPQWYAVRKGRPTGSQFGRIITPKKADFAEGRDTYAAELIAELLGWQTGFQGTPDTQRGNTLEAEAIRWLQFQHGYTGREVGFCLSDCGRYGASPDWLMTDNTPVEVKAPDIHTFIKWHKHWRKTGEVPLDHKAQCHGEMHVTGSDRCLFIAYPDHSSLEKLVIWVPRSDFTTKLGEFVEKFCDELEEQRRDVLGEEAEFYVPTIPEVEEVAA